jgi:predicted lactoylglutathione lyase
MKPRITVITLGVDDLEKSVDFYNNGLGLPTNGIIGKEFAFGAVAFFDLENGIRLALWPRKSIAHDANIAVQNPSSTEMTIGQNVNTRKEVDDIMANALRAGAKIIKPADDTFWGGYAGYFQDPDGHIWEIVYNPTSLVDEH